MPFFADLPPALLFEVLELLFADPLFREEELPLLPEDELLFALDREPPSLDAELRFAELEPPLPEPFPAVAVFEPPEDEPVFAEPEEALFDVPEERLLELGDAPFLAAPPDEPLVDAPPLEEELFDELPPEDERDDELLFDEALLLPPEVDF